MKCSYDLILGLLLVAALDPKSLQIVPTWSPRDSKVSAILEQRYILPKFSIQHIRTCCKSYLHSHVP